MIRFMSRIDLTFEPQISLLRSLMQTVYYILSYCILAIGSLMSDLKYKEGNNRPPYTARFT